MSSRIFAGAPQEQPPATNPCVNEKGKVLHVENGVTPPRLISTRSKSPEPGEETKAHGRKIEETVVFAVVVGSEGQVCDAKITRSTSQDKDFNEKVLLKIKQWKFEPARKSGTLVPVQIALEIKFNLY